MMRDVALTAWRHRAARLGAEGVVGMPAGGQQRRMLEAARNARRHRRQRPWLAPDRWRGVAAAAARWHGVAAAAAWWRGLSRRGRAITLGVTALAAAGAITAGVLISLGPQPRARLYLAFTACLLTDAHGLTGPQAAPVWAGMQDASLATHAKVEYLPVMSGPTAADAAPFLASLAARQCRVIVAAGPAPAAAVAASARRYPAIRFAVAGAHATGRNITQLPGTPTTLRTAADQLVTTAVAASN